MTETESIILELAQRMVDHPDDVVLRQMPGQSGTVMELECHADDEAKIIGKRGAHINALAFLVQRMKTDDGKPAALVFNGRTLFAPASVAEPRFADYYDPEETREMIERILCEMGIGEFAVEAKCDYYRDEKPIRMEFIVRTKFRDDLDQLHRPRLFIIRPANPEKGKSQIAKTMTILDALNTLLRVIARCDGVEMNLTTEET